MGMREWDKKAANASGPVNSRSVADCLAGSRSQPASNCQFPAVGTYCSKLVGLEYRIQNHLETTVTSDDKNQFIATYVTEVVQSQWQQVISEV